MAEYYEEPWPQDQPGPDSTYPNDPGTETTTPENTTTSPCGPGFIDTDLDASGNQIGNHGECITQDESNRRNKLWIAANPGIPAEPSGSDGAPDGGPGGGGTGTPSGRPNYGPVPEFDAPEWTDVPTWAAPEFTFGETWQAPTEEQAFNEPGYQFGVNEGIRALKQGAGAKGAATTGGTMKDLIAWGQARAGQQYGDVFNRNLTGFNTRLGTAKDVFDRNYAGSREEFDRKYGSSKDQFDRRFTSAQAEFAPKLFGWQQNAHGEDLGFASQWSNFWRNHLTAADIFGSA